MTEERATFRYAVGLIAVLGGLAGLVGLYLVEVPPGNRDALMLALGIVLAWGSSVVNSEWGSSPAGRKVAEIGAAQAAAAPRKVEVVNPPDQPVPVEERPP